MVLEYFELGERLVVDLLDVAVVERRAGSGSRCSTPISGFFSPNRFWKVMSE